MKSKTHEITHVIAKTTISIQTGLPAVIMRVMIAAIEAITIAVPICWTVFISIKNAMIAIDAQIKKIAIYMFVNYSMLKI